MEEDFCMDGFNTDDYVLKTKLLVKQLSLECPQKAPTQNCPLSGIRKIPLKGRLEFVDRLPAEQLEVIVQHHYDCFEERGSF